MVSTESVKAGFSPSASLRSHSNCAAMGNPSEIVRDSELGSENKFVEDRCGRQGDGPNRVSRSHIMNCYICGKKSASIKKVTKSFGRGSRLVVIEDIPVLS